MSWSQSIEKKGSIILFVNDDALALESKLNLIKAFKPEWNVIAADSPEKAKELFEAHPEITHIVTDKNMVRCNARQLLTWVSEHIAAHPEENRTFKGAVVYSSWEDEDFDRLESFVPRSGVGEKPMLDPKDAREMQKLDRFQIKGMRLRMLRKSDIIEPENEITKPAKEQTAASDRSSRLAGLPAPPSSDPWLDAVGRHLDDLSKPMSWGSARA